MTGSSSSSPVGRHLVPRLRRHPYRLLFPAGVLLSWAGIGHWLLHAGGWMTNYRPRFHAVAQTQGFMTCMAIGFLFTMIPRRTATEPPSIGQIGLAVAGPFGVVAAAWWGHWVVAQALWLTTAVMVLGFIGARFDGPGEGTRPSGFVWLPAAFLMGIAGAGLQLVAGLTTLPPHWVRVGEGLARQGFLVALIFGVGGALALPLMTRGESPRAARSPTHGRLARLAHLLGAVVLAGSFWVESSLSLSAAMALRAVVALGVLVGSARLWRPPLRPGANARIIWLAAWLLPAGYLSGALWPQAYRAGLHVALIGGFALLALAISAQVLLGHGGYTDVVRGWPRSALLMLVSMLGAIGARVAMEFDRGRFFPWMGLAAGLFLVATLAWWSYVWRAVSRPASEQP